MARAHSLSKRATDRAVAAAIDAIPGGGGGDPTASDENVTTAAGGANDTFDFPLEDGKSYELRIITIAKDQSTGKRFMRTSRVLAYAEGGAASMFSQNAPLESIWDADAGSLFDATSAAITKTGANIRVTHKAVANAVKWSTYVWVIAELADAT